MIACPNCGNTNLNGSTVVESGVNTICAVRSNPAGDDKPTRLAVKEVLTDNAALTLICKSCGAESELPTGVYYTVTRK
jgi:ribosomal protein S27E